MTSSFPLPTPCPSTAPRAGTPGSANGPFRFALTDTGDRTEGTPTSRLSARWNAEWAQICRSRRVAARLRQALADAVTFHTLDDLLDRCGRDRDMPMAEADQVLAHVVALAATDDDAARVVVQRILPGIVNVAARRSRQSAGDRQALFDELMSALWVLVRTYPLERRPAEDLVVRRRGGPSHVPDAQQVVPHALLLVLGELGRSDVHAPVELHRVGVDDLPVQRQRKGDAEVGLAGGRGAHHSHDPGALPGFLIHA